MNLVSAYYHGEDPFGIFKHTRSTMYPRNLTGKQEALILWGGEDISPAIYKQDVIHARAGKIPSARDLIEISLFNRAVELGIPIIGVCRGAQLACSLSGGTLFQHIEGGHHQNHKVETKDGHIFTTSSCHHQALNVENTEHDILAWDSGRKTRVYTDKNDFETVIPEVVYFPKTKAFAIQGHPEWMSPSSPFVQWCAKQIQERFF